MINEMCRGTIVRLTSTRIFIKPIRGETVSGKRPGKRFSLYQKVFFSMNKDWTIAHIVAVEGASLPPEEILKEISEEHNIDEILDPGAEPPTEEEFW